MKIILYILQKEFIQIFRNRAMLPIIFLVPVLQLVVLVHAATLEMKKIEMFVVDNDLSGTSRELVNKFSASPFYVVEQVGFSVKEAEESLKQGSTDVILVIPSNFEKELQKEKRAKVQLLVDAINGAAAGLIYAYSHSIIADYSNHIFLERSGGLMRDTQIISHTTSYWYNSDLNYKTYMLPGILVILVTLIGMFLSALNLVREKEMGTIEQINVTPIRKYQFIIGKLLPFWIIALFELAFGLTIGKVFFYIPIEGSLLLLFGFASVYLIAVMSIGLFISTISSTQQQVMFLAFFFLLTFIMMSGIFTPVESMPDWANYVNIFNPLAYFMRVIRMVLLKGSGFWDISREFFAMTGFATIMLTLAVWRYRKVA